MDEKDKIEKHLMNLYSGIQRENIKKAILLDSLKDYEIGSESYKKISSKIELITGQISMIDAVIQQQNRRLKELTSSTET